VVPPFSNGIPRVPPYSRTRDPPYPYGALTRYGAPFQSASGSRSRATGLIRFRSPLLAESRLLSFPPATEMFQFAGFASRGYGFTARYPKRGGLPHSDIPGSTNARFSPGLFAACHVLHRLSTPRHPPNALRSLHPPRNQERGPGGGGQGSVVRDHPHPPTTSGPPDTGTVPSIPMPQTPPRRGRSLDPPRARPQSQPLFTMSNDPTPPPRAPSGRAAATSSFPGPCPRAGAPAGPATPPSRLPSGRRQGIGGPGPIRTADLTLIRRAL
jgi:hypothetical protein